MLASFIGKYASLFQISCYVLGLTLITAGIWGVTHRKLTLMNITKTTFTGVKAVLVGTLLILLGILALATGINNWDFSGGY